MDEYKGVPYLKRKLDNKRSRVLLRYKFYEQKAMAADLGISTPKGLEWLSAINGWCTKAVDNLADRLQFAGFEDDIFNFEEMFNQNNPDIFYDDSMLSALISSCAFVLVTRGEENQTGQRIRFQVIDGGNATGVIDDFTKLLTEGYAVLERDENDNVLSYAYCTRGLTQIFDKDGKLLDVGMPYYTRDRRIVDLLLTIGWRF